MVSGDFSCNDFDNIFAKLFHQIKCIFRGRKNSGRRLDTASARHNSQLAYASLFGPQYLFLPSLLKTKRLYSMPLSMSIRSIRCLFDRLIRPFFIGGIRRILHKIGNAGSAIPVIVSVEIYERSSDHA